MAVVICLIAGVPAIGVNADGVAIGWLQAVLEAGTVRMGAAIMADCSNIEEGMHAAEIGFDLIWYNNGWLYRIYKRMQFYLHTE